MTNTSDAIIAQFDQRVQRRNERREFFKTAGTAAAAVTAATMLSGCFSDDDGDDFTSTPTPTPPVTVTPTPTPVALTDADILNFALNLEYLEAQFYSYAAFGTPLAANLLTGTGTQGPVTGGRKVAFTDPVVAQYAIEIAQDEITHVAFLRTALGSSAVAQPAIDVGASATGAFSAAARAAGLVGPGVAFDPYANDENFLLGAFIFEDVGVTAYKGASPLIQSKTFLEAAAGLLAAEAYHAGLVRTVLYRKGIETGSKARSSADAISNARDSLDGTSDLDQGISPIGASSNIVPVDSNGLAYSRTPGQVLNIAFLNRMAVTSGGFFPAGVNGTLRTSAAN